MAKKHLRQQQRQRQLFSRRENKNASSDNNYQHLETSNARLFSNTVRWPASVWSSRGIGRSLTLPYPARTLSLLKPSHISCDVMFRISIAGRLQVSGRREGVAVLILRFCFAGRKPSPKRGKEGPPKMKRSLPRDGSLPVPLPASLQTSKPANMQTSEGRHFAPLNLEELVCGLLARLCWPLAN